MKGWENEPIRHSLSSKGISTTGVNDNIINDEVPPPKPTYRKILRTLSHNPSWQKSGKEEVKKMIKLFWWCDITDNWEHFNFDEIFNKMNTYIKGYIRRKIDVELKTGDWRRGDEMYEYLDEIHREGLSDLSDSELKELARIFDEWCFHRAKEVTQDIEIYKDLRNYDVLSLDEKIKIFEKLIHAQHDRGNIWNIEDEIPQLRQEFKEEYL